MKVLLISANTEQFNMPAMPLGLACVAEAARKAGHDVTLLDLMFAEDTGLILKNNIAQVHPECIGISVRNIDDQCMASPRFLLEKVKAVVETCRDLSDAPIVIGGAGYSIFPESALAYLDADLGIQGEGESAFPALLAQLADGRDPCGIPGLYSRGRSRKRPKAISRTLDALPLPDPGILSASTSQNRDLWVPVQTRRGCALKCSYCSTPDIEGTILRKRSPGLFAAWLANWVEAGYTNFFFVDNTFNLPPNYAKEICRKILERKLGIRWRCIIYPNHIDRELVGLMAAAGCRQVSLGFESGSNQILKNLKKRFSPQDIRITTAVFADHNIERMGFLLLGSPGETKESVEASLAFVESLQLDGLRLSAGVRIYPNTPLAETAEKHGILSPQQDLLYPHFYLAHGMEGWLLERLQLWAKSRPNVIL